MSPAHRKSAGRMDLWPLPRRHVDGVLEVGVRLETPGSESEGLWYRVPGVCAGWVPDSLDPFVIGAVFAAMRRQADLRVHGRVSPSLLRNLEEFQSAWQCWQPERYRRVSLEADAEAEDPAAVGDRAALMFSGGLDSCFSAWRHTQGLCGRRRRNLQVALMVHGFDIPLADADVFQRAAENSRKLAQSVGLELIPMACNIRELRGDEWEATHGAALASCLHLLRNRFGTGMIAGSHTYETLRFPWGSNPLTDALLSTDSLAIVYDGAESSRHEKARSVAAWGEAMARMRVCWEGEAKDVNCGGCLRCVGTAICFAVEGQPIPASLPISSLEAAIERLSQGRLKPMAVTRLEELLVAARAHGIREQWMEALERCVLGQRTAQGGWRRTVDRLRRQFLRRLATAPGLRRSARPQGGML